MHPGTACRGMADTTTRQNFHQKTNFYRDTKLSLIIDPSRGPCPPQQLMLQAKGSRIAGGGPARPAGRIRGHQRGRSAAAHRPARSRAAEPPPAHRSLGTTLVVDDEERDGLPLASSNRFPLRCLVKGRIVSAFPAIAPGAPQHDQPRTGAGSFWPTCPAFRETVLGGPRSIPETEAA